MLFYWRSSLTTVYYSLIKGVYYNLHVRWESHTAGTVIIHGKWIAAWLLYISMSGLEILNIILLQKKKGKKKECCYSETGSIFLPASAFPATNTWMDKDVGQVKWCWIFAPGHLVYQSGNKIFCEIHFHHCLVLFVQFKLVHTSWSCCQWNIVLIYFDSGLMCYYSDALMV